MPMCSLCWTTLLPPHTSTKLVVPTPELVVSSEITADFTSHNFNDNTEWSLANESFERLTNTFSTRVVYLFASRLNCKVDCFVSWRIVPGAWATDAFTCNWNPLLFYAFPPFSVLGKVLAKVKAYRATGILVVPLWPTRPWFPTLLGLLIDHSRHIPPDSRNLLIEGNPDVVHTLHKQMSLFVVHVSGHRSKTLHYQHGQRSSSPMHGEIGRNSNMIPLYEDGDHFAFREILIPFLPL